MKNIIKDFFNYQIKFIKKELQLDLSDYQLEIADKTSTNLGRCIAKERLIVVKLGKHSLLMDVLDTVSHELAHAVTHEMRVKNERKIGNYYLTAHGDDWKHYAIMLGANPKATARTIDIITHYDYDSLPIKVNKNIREIYPNDALAEMEKLAKPYRYKYGIDGCILFGEHSLISDAELESLYMVGNKPDTKGRIRLIKQDDESSEVLVNRINRLKEARCTIPESLWEGMDKEISDLQDKLDKL